MFRIGLAHSPVPGVSISNLDQPQYSLAAGAPSPLSNPIHCFTEPLDPDPIRWSHPTLIRDRDHAEVPGRQFHPGVQGVCPRSPGPISAPASESPGCRHHKNRKADLEGPGWTVSVTIKYLECGMDANEPCRSSLGGTSTLFPETWRPIDRLT